MEKRVNSKIEEYTTKFKMDIREKILQLNYDDKEKANELMEYVFEYKRLQVQKDDLSKRKRVKNSIPASNRCNARRANNEQCTRRRKEGCEYCGTHAKGTPNGFLNLNESVEISRKMEVIAEEINGIVYYIDSFLNIYKTEDIMSGKENPEIIGKCQKLNGLYSINL
jgi:hypothetical protein